LPNQKVFFRVSLGIFNEYDKKFAVIREMAEANGDYREGLKKIKRIFEDIEI